MLEARLCNPRKRRNSEQVTTQQSRSLQHVSKKQKHHHSSGTQLAPAFWDNLSKIDLTRRALKELDRRNTRSTLKSRRLYYQPRGPITRSALKNIKQIARDGGPDLRDLRGVRVHTANVPNADFASFQSLQIF